VNQIKINLLNHASVLIEMGEVKLLCDAWIMGNCFGEGWAFRFSNPRAFALANQATHLWISHFHDDHFHVPSLIELAKQNKNVAVICNQSHNFGFRVPLKKFGFQNILPFEERKTMKLSSEVEVCRYPTTGIDNMLHIKTPHLQILNFNDCNISDRAAKAIMKKIGNIDILLNNFNHAEKIVTYPIPGSSEIKEGLKTKFINTVKLIDPKFVFPFASYHYYTASESAVQNDSMLTLKEVVDLDPRVLNIKIGGQVTFGENAAPQITEPGTEVTLNSITTLKRTRQYELNEIEVAFEAFRKRIKVGFLGMVFQIPKLVVSVTDLEKTVVLNIRSGLKEIENTGKPEISVVSEVLFDWFNKPYGTTQVVVGAHFAINSDVMSIKKWVLSALMVEAKLDLKNLIFCLFSFSGIRFLFNRREEIVSILLSRKLAFGAGSRS